MSHRKRLTPNGKILKFEKPRTNPFVRFSEQQELIIMTEPAQTRRVSFKSSIKIQDVTNAKKWVATVPEDTKKAVVGYIHGFCNSIVKRTAPDGSKSFEGMGGQFEVVPADENENALRSGICYLGDSFQPMVTDILRAQAGPDGRGQVTGVAFAFEIVLQRASNPQGYTWVLEPLTPPSGLDPLEETRQLLAKRLQAPKLVAPAHDEKKKAKA